MSVKSRNYLASFSVFFYINVLNRPYSKRSLFWHSKNPFMLEAELQKTVFLQEF